MNLGTGAVTLGANRQVTVSANTLTVGGAIGGGYSLTKAGSGTLVLSGTNTYTGATTNAGTLTINGSGSLGAGSYSGAISNGGTMIFGSSVAQTLAGPVSGSGTLNVSGSTVTLSGTNTYTGGTTNTGTLTLSGSGSLGGGSYSGAISNGGTMTFSSSVVQTLAGPISGSGTLTVSGSTVTLSGTNTFSGQAKIVGGGVLSVSSVSKALGNVSDILLGGSWANGTLLYTGTGETSDRVISYTAFNGSDFDPNQIIDQSGSGLLKFTSAFSQGGGRAHYLTLQGSTSGVGEIAGDISGSGGATTVVKNGTGTWTLSGNNAYTGGTLVNAGTLVVSNAAALGAATNLLTLASNTTSVVLRVAANMTSPQATTLSGGADGGSGTGSVIVDTLTNRTAQLQMNPSAGPVFPGLIVRNQGLLALSGTNTFNYFFAGNSSLGGNLLITNGNFVVLQSSGNSKFDQGANVTIGSNAVFAVGSGNGDAWFPLGDTAGTTNNMTLAGGSFIVTNVNGFQIARNGNAALTLNSGSVLVNDASALGIIMSEGGGYSTINLNGGRLTPLRFRFGGGVEVFNFNGGTLAANASRTDFLPSGGETANVRNGGAIIDSAGYSITIAQPLIHSGIAGDNAVDGGLTKNSNGTLTLSGANTYTGNTIINAGELIGQTGGSCANSAVTVAAGATNGVKVAAANGQWSCKSLTCNSGTTYADFDFGSVAPSTATAPLSIGGNLATNGTVQVIVRNGTGFTAGQIYPLMAWTGTGPGNLVAFSKPILPSGVIGTLTLGSKAINLNAGIYVPNLAFTNAPGVARIITTSDIIAAGLASAQSNPHYTITVGAPANGGAAFTNSAGTMMRYTNSPLFAAASDTFTYTVSDGTSSATATVSLAFAGVSGPTLNPSGTTGTDGNGHPVISFHGLPNYTYHMQRSPDLTTWTTLQAATCDNNGNATWTDTNTPIPNPVFYRLVYP